MMLTKYLSISDHRWEGYKFWYHRMRVSKLNRSTYCHILTLFGIRFILWMKPDYHKHRTFTQESQS